MYINFHDFLVFFDLLKVKFREIRFLKSVKKIVKLKEDMLC